MATWENVLHALLLHCTSLNLVQIFECFPQTRQHVLCKLILQVQVNSNLCVKYDRPSKVSEKELLAQLGCTVLALYYQTYPLLLKLWCWYSFDLSPVSCVWWSVLKDLLPVLLTGAGPLSAIDYLGNPRYQACGNISQAVSHHTAAVRRVPGVVAVGPRQQVCHGHEKVVEGNANDHIVIDPNVGGHHHHAIAHTWEKKTGREPTEEKH